jgi:hypothetical protein
MAVPLTASSTVAEDAARLGLEQLPVRGDDSFFTVGRLSCVQFGTNYVMVGMKVTHVATMIRSVNIYCAPLRGDGTLGTAIFLPGLGDPDGTSQEQKCGAGKAVVGYKSTGGDQGIPVLRSVTLHCASVSPNGLSTGAAVALGSLGVNSGRQFGPDMCTQGRLGREFAVHVAPGAVLPGTSIYSWRLGCIQPARP